MKQSKPPEIDRTYFDELKDIKIAVDNCCLAHGYIKISEVEAMIERVSRKIDPTDLALHAVLAIQEQLNQHKEAKE